MNNQVKLIDQLRTKLIEKVSTLDKRIDRRKGPCYFDESNNIDRMHSEAYVYEQVIKMIDELTPPVPIIKPGDKVSHKHFGTGRVDVILADKADVYFPDMFERALLDLSDLEVVE